MSSPPVTHRMLPVGTKPNGLQFGRAGPAVPPPGMLSFIGSNRTATVIAEDIFGFGVLRTTLDLFREYFYKHTEGGKRGLNIPAARERIIREMGCIFTANFLGGILAYFLAKG